MIEEGAQWIGRGDFFVPLWPPHVLKAVTVEMHNTFVQNVVSTERASLKTILMAGATFEIQLCISIAYRKTL